MYASSNSKKGVKKGDPIPVGLKTAEKIIAELNKSKSQPLGRVLFALGIRHVGKSVGEVIAERFLSIDKLILASEEDIAECEGIGPKIAASVKQFLAVPENLAVLERLRQAGLSLEVDLGAAHAQAAADAGVAGRPGDLRDADHGACYGLLIKPPGKSRTFRAVLQFVYRCLKPGAPDR